MKSLSKTSYIITMLVYGTFFALACFLMIIEYSTEFNALICVALAVVSLERIIKETRIYTENRGNKIIVKNTTKLFLIAAIFIGAYIIGNMMINHITTTSFRCILFTIILSIALSLVIKIGENYGENLIGIYGASLIPAGASGGLLLCTSFFSILGVTGNDTYIFDYGIFPACVFGIFFVTIGLILVIYQLKKDAIIPLLPFIIGMIIFAFLMNNIYTQATQNLMTIDKEHIDAMLFSLARMRDVVIISSVLSWGLIVYRIKSKLATNQH